MHRAPYVALIGILSCLAGCAFRSITASELSSNLRSLSSYAAEATKSTRRMSPAAEVSVRSAQAFVPEPQRSNRASRHQEQRQTYTGGSRSNKDRAMKKLLGITL